MTDIELFMYEAEFWSGTFSYSELHDFHLAHCPHLEWAKGIDRLYGANFDAQGQLMDQELSRSPETRMWFALMIAEEMRRKPKIAPIGDSILENGVHSIRRVG